ncbi:hypothetical protein ES332_D03G158100v1 [Gossypium tomentosum]|uniref:Uncharacterized protein n=1 Tax=Gossypium tomentosum TaxID=34277 RepID=A0A5D2LNI3_GOSTO|nr:hypothetical protein ES332_D03G158100v1 [Gossypium tomentosum]
MEHSVKRKLSKVMIFDLPTHFLYRLNGVSQSKPLVPSTISLSQPEHASSGLPFFRQNSK